MFRDLIKRIMGRETDTILESDVDELYKRPRSITDWLPWVDYDNRTQTFTLSDYVSSGVMFELIGVPTEAKTEKYLKEIQINIQTCLNHTIQHNDNPFILQFFVQDEESLTSFKETFHRYISDNVIHNPITQNFIEELAGHLDRVSDPRGYFFDNAVTNGPWNGKIRRIRVFLYRWLNTARTRSSGAIDVDSAVEINEVSEKFIVQMRSAGVRIRRCGAEDLYLWLVRWFNPNPETTNGELDKLLEIVEYPTDEVKTYTHDIAALSMLEQPVSNKEAGVWWFDNMPHRAITIDSIRRKPDVGHLTGERKIGENLYAVFDKVPPGTILSICITIIPQDVIVNELGKMRNASKGDSAEAVATERDATYALEMISNGDFLLPTVITLFLRGIDLQDLQKKTNAASALLLANGMHPIREKDELLPLHTYIKHLPMNYEPARDKVERKSRLMFSSDLAAMLPLYGRSRGTGNPGMIFFNRGAEPFVWDPLNKNDRSKNAFGVVLGPPGSGKSALMVYLLLLIVTIHNARIIIIEKGNSFKLFGDYCKRFGLSVNNVCLRPNNDVSLPPFSDALLMLDKEEKALRRKQYLEESIDYSDENDEDESERDYLGEMELKARVMITGGDPKEEAQMTRADRLSIRKAIVNAAVMKKKLIESERKRDQELTAKERQVLTEDVVQALKDLSTDMSITQKRRERARDMADAMELYCSGTAGHFFNRPGQSWPESDITIMEMGLLADEGYEDQLALGFMGLISQINGIVEREQYSDRPTFVLNDEAHLITTNVLLSPYLVKIVKMWRKLGTWLWLATQNLGDFPDISKKLLSMFEWWIAMVCPKEEIEQISRFKDLSEEEKAMLLAAHKEPGQYTEGVVMADKVQGLFRNVPPPIALALAMNEKHEKSERAKIMRKLKCSELDAAIEMAKRIESTFSRQN